MGYDCDSGLKYYRARYYDPSIGRFINEDPVMFAGSGNFYGYVANAQADLVDPFGLQAQLKPIAEPAPATPPGPVPVPPRPPVSTVETITGWLGDVLAQAGAVGAIVLANPLPLNQDELDWLRQRDHDRYKDVCHGQVPAGPNPCSTLSREIDRIKRCISLMIAFDARWMPGRHSDAISQWENGLNKLKDQYNKDCTPPKQCKKTK
jgi:RHS repeat-associated protein